MPRYKLWDKVMLPRHWNYNPKFDRDIWWVIRDIRIWRHISYFIGKTRYLEEVLRDMWGTALYTKEYDQWNRN